MKLTPAAVLRPRVTSARFIRMDTEQAPQIVRTFRVDWQLYSTAQAIASDRGETVSDVIRTALTEYVTAHTVAA